MHHLQQHASPGKALTQCNPVELRQVDRAAALDHRYDSPIRAEIVAQELSPGCVVDQLSGLGVEVDQDQVGATDQRAGLAAQANATEVWGAGAGADCDLDAVVLEPLRQVLPEPGVLGDDESGASSRELCCHVASAILPRSRAPDSGPTARSLRDYRHKICAADTAYNRLMDAPAGYFHWGFILISIPNLLILAGMIVFFAIALFIPMGSEEPTGGEEERR